MKIAVVIVILVTVMLPAVGAHAELDRVFLSTIGDIIDSFGPVILQARPQLLNSAFVFNDALSAPIVNRIASVPVSSAVAGVSFEMGPQGPVEVRSSWGPIFSQTASTLGKNGFDVGVSFTYLTLDQFNGVDPKDITFRFPNAVAGFPLELTMGTDLTANIYSIYGSWGAFSNLDIGVVVPVISLNIKGEAVAVLEDPGNREERTVSYDETATGIGDVAIRSKLSVEGANEVAAGLLLDVRVPTGDEKDYLGSSKTNVKLMGILSKEYDSVTPHLNVGFEYRGASTESDEVEVALGFDGSVTQALTFSGDVLGEFQLTSDNRPGTDRLLSDRSNVPVYGKDSIVDAAAGIRYNPFGSAIVTANILVPLNDRSLRSAIAGTIGLSVFH